MTTVDHLSTGAPMEAHVARPRALTRLLAERAPASGRYQTAWPGLEIVRADGPRARAPVVIDPCVCVVAQGSKRAYLGGEALTYDPLRYLVVAVPLPLETEIVLAAPDQPYLALRLRLQAEAIADLLLEMGEATEQVETASPGRGMTTSPISEALYGAVLRLVRALDDPTERQVLAPMAEREVLYHLLVGEQGALVRAMAMRDGQTYRIAQVLRFLQTNFHRPLDVATIARVANVSPSTLHHTFKAVTGSSPLQYLKQIRLHQARLLLLHDGIGVSEAAHRVGYTSDSQFSREYRRLFGASPREDKSTQRADASRSGRDT